MTLTERMMEGFQASQTNILSMMGSATTQRTTGCNTSSDFDKILDSKLGNNNASSYINRNDYSPSLDKRDFSARAARAQDVRAEAEPRYKTFSEARSHSKVRSSATGENAAGRISDNAGRAEKSSKSLEGLMQQDSSVDIIQVMAQMFGLDMTDLRKLLDEAGFDSNALNSIQGISEVSADLSQLFGLTGEQQTTLDDMLNLAGQFFEFTGTQEVTTDMPDEFLATSTENAEFAQANKDMGLDSALLEAFPQATEESLLEQLSEQIKSRLNEYAKMLEEGNGLAHKETENLLLPLLEKSAIKGRVQPALEEETPVMDIEAVETDTAEVSSKEAERGAQSNSAGEGSQQLNARVEPQAVLSQTRTGSNNPQSVFAAFSQDTQLVSEMNVNNIVSTVAATPKQILSQIIDEAKVILTPEKSEMLMELQPESLGKLSLKVVTEKGIVMAKFVAENQQVKEVLESNMQLLKDALQKQGMEVQGFSVSVRQDSTGNGGNSRQYDRTDWPLSHSNREIAGIEAKYPGITHMTAQSNPYILEDSTINLTA